MAHETLIIAAAFALYLLFMLLIGALAYRRTQGMADYILGGRRLGAWVAALSAGASDMSGWLLLGLPGAAYAAGLSASWIAVGLLTGTYLNWRLIAPRLRRYSEALGDALTLPSYFERRFEAPNALLRIASAFFILFFFLFYTTSGLVAGGKLFESVFGLPYVWAVSIGTAVIITYTLLGGFLAVSWTDLVQGLLMAAALLIVPISAFQATGGVEATLATIAYTNPDLLDLFTDAKGQTLGWIALLSSLGWGLGYFGQPHILARFKAIRSTAHIPHARRIALGWTALSLGGALLVGLAGIAALNPPLQGAHTEKVFILLVQALFHPVIAGILLAAILAAIMSTADSQLLVASTALAEDLHLGGKRRIASPAKRLWLGRLAVLIIAASAWMLALAENQRVLDLVAYAWGGLGAAFGPALALSLFWKRMTWGGALAGILAGGLGAALWRRLEGGVFELYEIIPAVVLSACAVVVFSLLGAKPAADLTERHKALFSGRCPPS